MVGTTSPASPPGCWVGAGPGAKAVGGVEEAAPALRFLKIQKTVMARVKVHRTLVMVSLGGMGVKGGRAWEEEKGRAYTMILLKAILPTALLDELWRLLRFSRD